MSTGKKVFFICATILIVLGLVFLGLMMFSKNADDKKNENTNTSNANVSNTTVNINTNANANADINANTSKQNSNQNTTTTVTNIGNENTNQNENQNASVPTNESEEWHWNGERIPNREDGYVTYDKGALNNALAGDDDILAQYDRERIEWDASEFVTKFYSYTADSIGSGQYVGSYSRFLSSPANFIEEGDLQSHSTIEWQNIMSSHREVFSETSDANCNDVYISHLSDNRSLIAARVSAQVSRNQGEPGELEWSTIHTYKDSYAVYFDLDYRIIGVKRNSSKLL